MFDSKGIKIISHIYFDTYTMSMLLYYTCVMHIRTHTRVEPKHPLPPHAVVELGRSRVLARAIRP